MFAKIALIVGLMICASINTEAKRRLPAPGKVLLFRTLGDYFPLKTPLKKKLWMEGH